MKKYLLINPGLNPGGSNLLFARVMLRMRQRYGCELALVDYAGGATWRFWTEAGAPFDFIEYNPRERHLLPKADLVLMGLLGAKILASNFDVSPASRLLTWCTAPQDPFKFLPPAYFFNNSSWATKNAFARHFYPAHRRRIADFLKEGARRGGVVFMDKHCHQVNEDLFGPGILEAVIPICTGVPTIGPRLRTAGTGKAYWVGRITDFKTEPFIAMTKALLRQGSPIKKIVVIGDGADLSSAKERLAGLAVTWLGYVEPKKLDAELHAHADLVFGHATALLEAAKLGIPSLLVDGTYESVSPSAVRADWLHRCPSGYVGCITLAERLIGRPVEECLAEFTEKPEQLAAADHVRWQEVHHPDVVADRLAEVIACGDYTAKDFLGSGAARPGWFGATIDWIKLNIFRRRY